MMIDFAKFTSVVSLDALTGAWALSRDQMAGLILGKTGQQTKFSSETPSCSPVWVDLFFPTGAQGPPTAPGGMKLPWLSLKLQASLLARLST